MAECAFCGVLLVESDRCGACRRDQPVQAPPGAGQTSRSGTSGLATPGATAFIGGVVFVLIGSALGLVFAPLSLLVAAGFVLLVVAAMTFASAVWQRLDALAGRNW